MPLSYLYFHINPSASIQPKLNTPNILIIVFDALSSHNMSLYGYPRVTTPNIDTLANNATVYHRHYAAGNFTTPGTASLLTGTYPWSHRAFQINSQVTERVQKRNIYNLFNDYHRMTYSHNQLVNILQAPFAGDIDLFKLREDLILGGNKWVSSVFRDDEDAATVSWARGIGQVEDGYSSSLFLSNLFNLINKQQNKRMELEFPLGLPISSLDNFLLEQAIDWVKSEIIRFPTPFLGYFHFLPPHAPYNTRAEYIGAFSNTAIPNRRKPKHPLAKRGRAEREYGLDTYRRTYDEYVLYVDSEFNRLYQALENSGITENTTIILTSDHGEMFERDILGHTTPSLHDPLVRIPLLIFDPGQEKRKDIYTNTSAVDILPTLLHLTGKTAPSWIEGTVLPPYQPVENRRSIFALEAKTNKQTNPITSASGMVVKGAYKLTRYFGYNFLPRNNTLVELYNIENDPEELENLVEIKTGLVKDLTHELNSKIQRADEPYL
jgi:arylsulfatase A-like enzyme